MLTIWLAGGALICWLMVIPTAMKTMAKMNSIAGMLSNASSTASAFSGSVVFAGADVTESGAARVAVGRVVGRGKRMRDKRV